MLAAQALSAAPACISRMLLPKHISRNGRGRLTVAGRGETLHMATAAAGHAKAGNPNATAAAASREGRHRRARTLAASPACMLENFSCAALRCEQYQWTFLRSRGKVNLCREELDRPTLNVKPACLTLHMPTCPRADLCVFYASVRPHDSTSVTKHAPQMHSGSIAEQRAKVQPLCMHAAAGLSPAKPLAAAPSPTCPCTGGPAACALMQAPSKCCPPAGMTTHLSL